MSSYIYSHNIIFDAVGGRIGFAESDCDYSELKSSDPTILPTLAPTAYPSASPLMPAEWIPFGPCDAVCNDSSQVSWYNTIGLQKWLNVEDGLTTVDRTCTLFCSQDNRIVFSSPSEVSCPLEPWSGCNKLCKQSRNAYKQQGDGNCGNRSVEVRDCYCGNCPIIIGELYYYIYLNLSVCLNLHCILHVIVYEWSGDVIIQMGIVFRYPMLRWSELIGEDIALALSSVLQVIYIYICLFVCLILCIVEGF